MHFARVLRAAGLPVGTDRVLLAYEALRVAGVESRRDLHAVLTACFVDRATHRLLFDQAFHVFWKDPDLLGKIMQMLMPQVRQKASGPSMPQNRRLGEALFKGEAVSTPDAPAEERVEIDATLTASEREQLHKADFDTMSNAEWLAARRMLEHFDAFPRAATDPSTCAIAAWPHDRSARDAAGVGPARRRAGRAGLEAATPASGTADRDRRHLGIDEPLFADVPALPARDHQRCQCSRSPRALLRIRHAPDCHHAPVEITSIRTRRSRG